MCGFVRARISVVLVRSSTILLQGARDKEAYIHQIPDLTDGVVMALIALGRG